MAKRASRKKTAHEKFLIGLGDVVDRLCSVNIKISILESVVKSKSNPEAGKAAKLIRKLNIERLALRNALNIKFGSGFEDVKVEYYELLEKPNKK